jgi:CRISPR-associated protein Csx1
VSGAGRTLIIAPWGQPAFWRTATYLLDDIKIDSCTSLTAVVEGFGDESDVVILTLDSLLDEYLKKGEGKCYECYDSYRDLVKKSADAKTYDEALNTLKEFVKDFVKCLGLSIEPYVVVCPAVGSPGNIWRFTGHPTDFEAVALYHLGKLCIEKPYTRLVLDLTHGVNFMPAVTLKLAEKLASIILAAHMGSVASLEEGVELQVYNSDPLPSGAAVNNLNINRIMKDRIKTIIAPHDLPKRLIRHRTKEIEQAEELLRINEKYLNAVQLPLSAIYYPLPLALCEMVFQNPAIQQPATILEDAFNLWYSHVKIGGGEVDRLLGVDPDAVYALYLVEAFGRRLKAEVKPPPTVEDFKKLAKLYKVVNKSFYYLIMDEISHIERSLDVLGGWMPLHYLYSEDVEKRADKRIMIAHAGLQKELVEVNSLKQLRYRRDVSEILREAGLLVSAVEG